VKALFWLSILLVVYTYVLYPGSLFLRARFCARPVDKKPIFPRISIIMAVRNEGKYLTEKLRNLTRLDYPADQVEIVIVSDGSTDQTNEILKDPLNSKIRSIFVEAHCGKAAALNIAVDAAAGEIIVFMDARQRIDQHSLARLVENFADPSVGCVSGALMLGQGDDTSARGVAWYWGLEKVIRYWEGVSGSTVGATGALYAVRRCLVARLPTGIILDDVFIPMSIARQGARVIFEPRALASDNLPSTPRHEFRRKVRTLFGNYQLLRLAPWLLTRENPIRFEFVSHKLCRLAVPFALIGMLLSSLYISGFIYKIPLATAIVVAALGAVAFVRVPVRIAARIADLALAFVLLNAAALIAFFYFSLGKKRVWFPNVH
jgi:biofilm PGA synthesis N-glycosyltransferase PgaC